MKTKLNFNLLWLFLLGVIVLNSCSSKEDIYFDTNKSVLDGSVTRSAFNGYFEWDRVNSISTLNPYTSEQITLTLPWAKGSTQNIGIPETWLDENAEDPTYNKRFYSRERGWELVYSNLHLNTSSKFFALYNKYVGLLRFFFYEISAGGYGTTVSFWGIAADKSTSLFNFTTNFAAGADVSIKQPAQIITPKGTFTANSTSGIGYKGNNWYGMELECAYDPLTSQRGALHFNIKGWGANRIVLQGSGMIKGSIIGTIKSTKSNSAELNNSLDSELKQNNTETSIIIDEKEVLEDLANKSNSVMKDSVGMLVNSLITDNGGSSTSGTKTLDDVNLSVYAITKSMLEGETPLVGWGAISPLPVPGTSFNTNDEPLYNKPLGVWTLAETPIVTVDTYTANTWLPVAYYSQYRYTVNKPKIILNPEINSIFNLRNIKTELSISEYEVSNREHIGISPSSTQPSAFINNVQYYSSKSNSTCLVSNVNIGFEGEYELGSVLCYSCIVRVSFDLVNKKDPNEIYSFSKYFKVKPRKGINFFRKDVYPAGNGKLIPFPI